MRDVRDETKRTDKRYDQTQDGKIASAQVRSRFTRPLRRHTDSGDVIARWGVTARNRTADSDVGLIHVNAVAFAVT